MVLTFELDLCQGDGSYRAFIDGLRLTIERHGGKLLEHVEHGPAGGNSCVLIAAPDEASAFTIVDELYGPENHSRESNAFYVYWKE